MKILLVILSLGLLAACATQDRESPLYRTPRPSPQKEIMATPTENQVWTMTSGLLRSQVERWAQLAGYLLIWKVSRDYYLQSPVEFTGTFQTALTKLFTGMQQRGNALRAIIYKGNNVVLVTEE
ncbi:MAG: toxin co-regulated pilus biosynthesis Q family protein [Desulfovibrio sp.]|nr:toxin co-regulated pilus biosynthesis Q family protein [Desulfovibrio sp.]